MSPLWRGPLSSRVRIASGLVLFTYALFHFLNIGLGLFSPVAMEEMQQARHAITRSWGGTILIYGALLTHAGLALARLGGRGTLRMPLREAAQLGLGLLIPLFLITHITFTRGAHELFGVNDSYVYLVGLIWGTTSGWTQAALLLIVWVHGSIGLNMWLRPMRWWRAARSWLIGAFVLIPGFALAGFIAEGRRLRPLLADPVSAQALRQSDNWPDGAAFQALFSTKEQALTLFWLLLGLSALGYLLRRLVLRRNAVRVAYVDGPRITAPRGLTLLEMSRQAGVPHTALCGGRGRCTTCRVLIEDGDDRLPAPSASEAASLKAVGAQPGTRLACQIRPVATTRVFRVFGADGRRLRAHASQGEERRLAILFLDMRSFTALTTGQLPYDVVFLLNRFFDAIVPAITQAGGTVDKYLGDGLLAVFETTTEAASARASLRAAEGVSAALARFNEALRKEGGPDIRIGIGVHLGDLVLGEIGAAGSASRTIIGDAVNAASRLEARTKELQVELLVSQPVLISAGYDTDRLDLIDLNLRGVRDTLTALAVARASTLPVVLATAQAQDPGQTPSHGPKA